MSLAAFNADGPSPPLEVGEYVRCNHCQGLFSENSVPMPYAEDGFGRVECPSCEQTKGFVRHTHPRPGTTFAEQWPQVRRITTMASSLILHLDKLGLRHYDLAILAYYEAHRFGGPTHPSYPRVRTLATTLGISERQVRKRIEVMTERGFCVKQQRYRPDGRQTTFNLTREGLTAVAAYIDKHEQADGSVPGLDAVLERLRPPAPHATLPLHTVQPPPAPCAGQEEAVREEASVEEEPLSRPDSANPGPIPEIDDELVERLILAFDATEITGEQHEPQLIPREGLCPYDGHRSQDWQTQDGRWICGVCHPPALPSLAVRWAA